MYLHASMVMSSTALRFESFTVASALQQVPLLFLKEQLQLFGINLGEVNRADGGLEPAIHAVELH